MDHTFRALSRTSRNLLKERRDRCSLCQSPLYTTQVRGPILNRRKEGHTSEDLSRRADRNGAIPQISVVIGQLVATGGPLARRYDATNKGVWSASIPFKGGHTPSDLPGR